MKRDYLLKDKPEGTSITYKITVIGATGLSNLYPTAQGQCNGTAHTDGKWWIIQKLYKATKTKDGVVTNIIDTDTKELGADIIPSDYINKHDPKEITIKK